MREEAKIPALTAVLVSAETFAPSSPQEFARIVADAWPVEERHPQMIVVPIMTGAPPTTSGGSGLGAQGSGPIIAVTPSSEPSAQHQGGVGTSSGVNGAVETTAMETASTESAAPAPKSAPISQVVVSAPAIRAALDIASAPPAERAEVVAAVKEQYAVPVKQSDDSLVPFLPVPQLVDVTAELDVQFRTFRATASSQ